MKQKTYKEYDYKTDDDLHYYWIEVKCSNCTHTSQIAIKKGVKTNPSRLKLLNCPRCEVRGTLQKCDWDGKKYVVI